jgi:hypothetical protein
MAAIPVRFMLYITNIIVRNIEIQALLNNFMRIQVADRGLNVQGGTIL